MNNNNKNNNHNHKNVCNINEVSTLCFPGHSFSEPTTIIPSLYENCGRMFFKGEHSGKFCRLKSKRGKLWSIYDYTVLYTNKLSI